MVESTALEMRHTRKGIVGSNPTLSATVNPWGARVFPDFIRTDGRLKRAHLGACCEQCNTRGTPLLLDFHLLCDLNACCYVVCVRIDANRNR